LEQFESLEGGTAVHFLRCLLKKSIKSSNFPALNIIHPLTEVTLKEIHAFLKDDHEIGLLFVDFATKKFDGNP